MKRIYLKSKEPGSKIYKAVDEKGNFIFYGKTIKEIEKLVKDYNYFHMDRFNLVK